MVFRSQPARTRRLRLREAGGFLLALGGALFGAVGIGAVDGLEIVANPQVALGVVATGLFLSIAGFWPVRSRGWRGDASRIMTLREVEELHVILGEFGPTSALGTKLEIYRKNPKCFLILERVRPVGEGRPVVGYCVMYGLTKAAVRKLKQGALTGPEIRASDIVPARWTPYGLYISFLWGNDRLGKASAIATVRTVVRRCLVRRGTIPIFARIATSDSLRLARRHEWSPLEGTQLKLHTRAFKNMALENEDPHARS